MALNDLILHLNYLSHKVVATGGPGTGYKRTRGRSFKLCAT